MARSVSEIKLQIETSVRTFSSLDDFLFPTDVGGSKVSRFNVLIHSTAVAIAIFEAIQDIFLANAQEIIDSTPVHNTGNTRNKILNFQFGDIIGLDANFVPTYPIPDDNKKIVIQCAVVNSDTDLLTLKIAKSDGGSGLIPLTAPELQALQDYYYGTAISQGVGVAGVAAVWVNQEADRLYVLAEVHFLGQFDATVVKTEVIAAMDNFLLTFQQQAFNGEVFMNRLVDAMQVVAGVSRVTLNLVQGRSFNTAFGSGVTVNAQGTYPTVAGYVIQEDDGGNTFNDSITMVLETLGT